MVYGGNNNPGSCDWVAFEQEQQQDTGTGFEAVVRSRRDSSKRRTGDAANTVASWMKQPMNADASWAPVVPPESSAEANQSGSTRRPPRQSPKDAPNRIGTSSKDQRRRQKVKGSNPVSSSDSSASSNDRPRSPSGRGRSIERQGSRAPSVDPPASRRGRSRTRGVAEPPSASTTAVPTTKNKARSKSRGRSSSRSRAATKERERSTSTTRRSSATSNNGGERNGRGRSNSRPPPTNGNRRSRSNSRTTVTRARSTSRTRTTNRPPPSTSRTRREMRTNTSSSNSVGPGLPPRRGNPSNRSVASDDGSMRSADANIGRDISFGKTKSGRNLTPTSSTHKRSGLMEKLFGDQVSEEAKQAYLPRDKPSPTASISSMMSWQQPEQIHSRILLTATVYHNTATNLWIATINTNQKGVAKNPATASKYLKAFSFSSEREARESAIANAPPKMISFEECPNCFICKGKFAVFRRASHCRNCGVCVCNSCSTTWPAKMIPETYNLKKESQVRICKSCNFLSGTFKKALLDGDYEEAVALYGSGNVNLRTPFPQSSKKKEEVMHPIHCAVEGGNLNIVRWLMDDHFCPIKVIRTNSAKKPKRTGGSDLPILTSRNRSVLSIAMAGLHVDILRYLVIECGVSIYESRDLKGSLRALEAVLLALPQQKGEQRGEMSIARWDDQSFDGEDMSETSSLEDDETMHDEDGAATVESKDQHSRKNADACIICYDNAIDCVMTPCGHQVCCLECSKNLAACPVCNIRGQFIKIFRP